MLQKYLTPMFEQQAHTNTAVTANPSKLDEIQREFAVVRALQLLAARERPPRLLVLPRWWQRRQVRLMSTTMMMTTMKTTKRTTKKEMRTMMKMMSKLQ